MMPKSQKVGIILMYTLFALLLGAALQSWNISSKCNSKHPFFSIGDRTYECAFYDPEMWGPK